MEAVEPDRAAVAAFWSSFCAQTGRTGEPADVFAFGDSASMADELADLVLAGTKRATAGALTDHTDEGFVPAVGDHAVVVRGDGSPAAVLRTTEVRVGPLSSVDDAFAWDEGEGDRTRDGWVAGHRAFFRRWFAATGKPADEDPELVFERFVLVWPDVHAERTTARLRLRRWRKADRPAFAAMNADPAVMEHLPEVLDRSRSDALLDHLDAVWDERGAGLWAVERRTDGVFLGWAGLNPMPEGTPPAGEWEVGWRFVREAWGHGYATEAAREAVEVARARQEPRLWSMTVPANVRSIAVMRRLGLTFDRTFEHPRFPVGHRLREHVLYRLDLAPAEF
ncbi:GNAT family N-acetyltransferase [Microlunatus flavus]|uniref:Uncharacterized protein YhfF n=1 Tax=Microlunatus flavus TaxID=1036181 RepID=A0A1H9NFK4_9ACTN|nr:GNAT family N-acetyltransferase [Microlunatus flavus]SER34702.1 Uncharacterized protein YhfF [Microlunatus flavus]